MLRVLSERRAWVFATLVALVLLAMFWGWGVARASSRASRLIGDRLGVDARVEETRFKLGGAELRDVELRGRHGGFVARIERIDVRVSMLGAIFRGAGAVRQLSARGIDVAVDLSEEGFEESLEEVRSRIQRRVDSKTERPSSSGPAAGRSYEVSGLRVRVVDAEGALLSIDDMSVRKEGHDLSSSTAGTLIGDRDADHAYVGPTKIALRRTDRAWTLSLLEIGTGNVRALRDGDDPRKPLASRVRDAIALLRGAKTGSDQDSDEHPEASGESVEGAPSSARLFARLSPDTSISVSGIQIESRASHQSRVERIRDFRASVDGGDNGWFRVGVGGETSNRGTLSIDLSVKPSEARADGSVELRKISLALIAPFVPDLPLYDTEAGTVTAQLELAADSSDRIAIKGGLRVRELALFSERIAAVPVEQINFDIRGKGVWRPEKRRLEIEGGQIKMNDARAMIDGVLERTSEHYLIDMTARLPPTDCNDVVGAIPRDILGSLSRFEWSGNLGGVIRLSLDSRDLEAAELSFRLRDLCQFEQTPRWVRVERFQEPFRFRAIEPDETVFQMVTGPGTDNWVAFADISPFMVPAVISHEDGGFYDHAGFAPWAIRDALVRNLQEGRYVVGASTISMQLAKNLYLQREKTIARKVQEVILTWWLESALTKEQILELYLNVIEYGPSVYGLKHAAEYYFGRRPDELSPAESAYLACMLPSPKRYHVSYERGALTRSMKNRSRRLLEHMAKRERIGAEALSYGLGELDDFHFHRSGDPMPTPRSLPPLGAPEGPEPAVLDPFEALFVAP